MRSLAAEKGALLGKINSLFSCCDCGLCSYYACNFGLAPHVIMGNFKKALMAEGVKPKKEIAGSADAGIANKKVPMVRLLARLDLKRYDLDAPLVPFTEKIPLVRIPLKMHIGAPCKALVAAGAAVKKGALIAEAAGLGAPIHASIDGVVSAVSAECIEIKAERA
jgi:Na+-translocating ferredoxin:NAD+ oxidoreductase RnfC subunit